MITKTRLLEVANAAIEQSKGHQYTVRALSRTFTAYPFLTNGVAIPAKVQQFAVESFSLPPAKHVVSIARSAEGFSVWCGDRLTEGMLPSHETFKRVLPLSQATPERGELIAFVMALTAPLGGLSSSEYIQLNALLSKVANPSRPHPNQD